MNNHSKTKSQMTYNDDPRQQRPPGKIIKINTDAIKTYSPLKEKAHRKYNLDIHRETQFLDPTVTFDDAQKAKFLEFTEYCRMVGRSCFNCGKRVKLSRFYATDTTTDAVSLEAQCEECLSYVSDSSSVASGYIDWFNNILSEYGLSFKDGWPSNMRHEILGIFCLDCKKHHTTIEYLRVKQGRYD